MMISLEKNHQFKLNSSILTIRRRKLCSFSLTHPPITHAKAFCNPMGKCDKKYSIAHTHTRPQTCLRVTIEPKIEQSIIHVRFSLLLGLGVGNRTENVFFCWKWILKRGGGKGPIMVLFVGKNCNIHVCLKCCYQKLLLCQLDRYNAAFS